MSQSGVRIDAALAEAKSAHESGDLKQAGRMYRKVLSQDPKCAPALNLYGILASQRGDNASAIKRITQAIAIDGSVVDYHINLAVVQETAGDLNAAFDRYAAALAIEPRNPELLGRLSPIAQSTGRYEDFVSTLSSLCAAMPDYAEAFYLRGLSLNILRRMDEAADSLRKAVTLAPGFTQGYANLASVLMDSGKPAEALAACNDCLLLDPAETFALATKAIALAEQGDYEKLRPLMDFDTLLDVHTLDLPPGYDSIEIFNAALRDAVLTHPSLRLDPNHRSCHFATQTDDLFLDPAEPFVAFETMIREAANDYRRKLDRNAAHPFLANPMPETALVGWATVMRAQGHQSAHIHPTSWLSGVYYVTVPDLVRRGDNAHKGWIEFGRPPEHYPITVDPDVTFLEPVEGKLILFPSYLYHRTVPYEDDAMRISIAFDFDTTLAS
ncbi:MAG: tetratricopeptide repeat protein [Alphaproteobacteria bacterium]|nr:tetratricopeptide repeat protein [Alphaproteobacteria bacterium]